MNIEGNAQLIHTFIDQIWNNKRLDLLDKFLHPDYRDYSLPEGISPDSAGFERWVTATGRSFLHRTFIEDQVTEGNKSIVRIKMEMTHIGNWRGIAATGIAVTTYGFRSFVIDNGRIKEHYAQINGEIIEAQLRSVASTTCQVAPVQD